MGRHLDLSTEQPSGRADAAVLPESTGLTFKLELGPVKFDVNADETQSMSPSAIGISMLLLSAASSVPAVALTMANAMLHAPATLMAVGSIVLFLMVFGTGTFLMLRGGAKPAAGSAAARGRVPAPRAGRLSRHLPRLRPEEAESGSTR